MFTIDTLEKALLFNINLFGYAPISVPSREMLCNACNNMTTRLLKRRFQYDKCRFVQHQTNASVVKARIVLDRPAEVEVSPCGIEVEMFSGRVGRLGIQDNGAGVAWTRPDWYLYYADNRKLSALGSQ